MDKVERRRIVAADRKPRANRSTGRNRPRDPGSAARVFRPRIDNAEPLWDGRACVPMMQE